VWSDGSKITSHDIKYTWEWMANPTISGNVYNYYQTQAVVGNREVYDGAVTEMTGLVAVDDDTLQITLTQPYTPFLYYCTHCLMGVHQRANIENGGPDWDKKPTIASGPFMVESFDVNTGETVLVQNPFWWGQKPTITRVEQRAIPDVGTQLITWTNNECEVWSTGATTDFLFQYGLEEIVEHAGPSARFFLLNTKNPPLDDIHVRRALQRATDVQTMISAVFVDYADYAIAATGISHPTDPAFANRPFLFDVEAAKAEFAQSKYAGGDVPPIVAVVSGDYIKLATVMQQMWQDALGIQLQVVPADQASAQQAQDASIQQGGNSVLYIGPGGLLSWGWHKDNYWFNGRINTVDEEVEALLTQGDAIPDERIADRVTAYQQAEALILDRGYTIPLHHQPWALCAKARVINRSANPTNTFDLINTYIAQE
jgi:peptide/nickel transport system substrate-binding protein